MLNLFNEQTDTICITQAGNQTIARPHCNRAKSFPMQNSFGQTKTIPATLDYEFPIQLSKRPNSLVHSLSIFKAHFQTLLKTARPRAESDERFRAAQRAAGGGRADGRVFFESRFENTRLSANAAGRPGTRLPAARGGAVAARSLRRPPVLPLRSPVSRRRLGSAAAADRGRS